MIAVAEKEPMGAEQIADRSARIPSITDALNGVTTFAYDPNGNLLTLTDAKNQTTTYTYDNMDRLATRKDALNRTESYQYDLAGNLTQFTDRKNQVTTFQYDELNRRTQATYPDATTSFIYDTAGRLVKASDTSAGAGSIEFAYDILDRLIQETTPQGIVGYQYDVLGRRTQMTANGQQPTTYQYDAASRLTRVEQGALFAALGYDNANRRTSLSYANNTTTSYAYDLASRLTNITHNGPGGLIEALTYQYDAAGNRVSLTRGNGTASLLPNAVASATYDAANEQTAFAGATLTYDANGNLTNDGTNIYTWDTRDRLMGRSGPGLTESYQYDALGRRVSKTINGTSTQFLYDGNDITAEIGNGSIGGSYLRDLELDEAFARQSGNLMYYQSDEVNSTLTVTDAAGVLAEAYAYEAFGKAQPSNAISSNSFQFTGRENDETGLYYYRARYYSPSRQRFVSEDPIEFAGGDVNLYAYVQNDPVHLIDPMGLATIAFPNVLPPDCLPPLDKQEKYFDTFLRELRCSLNFLPGIGGVKVVSGITGFTKHGINTAISRGVSPSALMTALRNPLKITPVRIDSRGLPSYKQIGSQATVTINPVTQKIVQVNPTSTRLANKLGNK